MSTCLACGSALAALKRRGNPRKWCSESCRVWAFHNPGQARSPDWQVKRSPVTRSCEQCARPFTSPDKRARFCSLSCSSTYKAAQRWPKMPCAEPGCDKQSRSRGMCKTHYNKATGHYIGAVVKDPERERARLRIKTHRRKDWARLTDVTPEYELDLRAKAKRCPLCEVKMTDEPYLPHSKETDHIVPRGAGGTHTIGNLRVICRTCNLARPWDGSDYTGPVSLWTEVA